MRKRTKFLTLLTTILMCVAMAFGAVACGGDTDGAGGKLTLNKTTMSISVGSSDTINANVAAEWSIDDPEIATLTSLGKVCAVKALKEGTATITATADGETVTCRLTVTPDNTEKVSITMGGEEVTTASVEMGKTITLVGTASQGSALTWKSSKESVATVENGVVTGNLVGTAVITAQVTPSIKAEVTVTVTAPEGSDYYNLVFATEWGHAAAYTNGDLVEGSEEAVADKFYYWSAKFDWGFQEVVVDKAYYQEGAVNFEYTCDTDQGQNFGFQLFYKNSEHTLNNYYKLECKINVDQDCDVTLNGNVISLTEGDNTVTVYYQYTSGLGTGEEYGISSFDLVMGVADGSNGGKGTFVQNAKVKVSDVKWTDDTETRVTLKTPSFTYAADTGVITISDTNTEGVKEYRLKFYSGADMVGSVVVKNGEVVDTSSIDKGNYTVKLYAVAANAHYIDSADSADSATIEVTTGASYELGFATEAEAVKVPGKWFVWGENWVTISGTYSDGTVEVTFSNNAGVVHAAQIFYKNGSNVVGKLYKTVMDIDSPAAGAITVNGNVIELTEGMNTGVEIVSTESAGASVLIMLCDKNATLGQGVDSTIGGNGTIKVTVKSVNEVEPTKLAAPTFSVSDNKVTITDETTNPAGKVVYQLGFFKDGEGDAAVVIDIADGDDIDLSKVPAGTYTVKIRANGTTIEYTASDWSTATATITSGTTTVDIGSYNNAGETYAIDNPGTYVYWDDNKGLVTVCTLDIDGTVTVTFANANPVNWYDVQLFWHNASVEASTEVKLTLKINASVAGKVTLCGTVLDLVAGDNNVTVTYVAETVRKPSWAGESVHALEGATFDMQFGVEGVGAHNGGTFVLSDIAFGAIDNKTTLTAPTFTLTDGVIAIEDPNDAGVAGYALGFFSGDDLITTMNVTNGATLNYSAITNGTYTVKLKALKLDMTYEDSDWSTSTAEVTVANEFTAIEYSEEGAFSTGWRYWASNSAADWNSWTKGTVEYARINGDGAVIVKFAIEGTGANWAVQMFYKSETAADGYNVSFKIKSDVATTIRACGQDVTLTANTETTVTATGYKSASGGSAIDIQCGLTSATFTITEIVVTAA